MGSELLKGKKILAVDDEPDVLDVLDEEFSRYGAELDRAASYGEGIRKLSFHTYDLVILAIMRVRGFELLEFARTRDMPVVMLTAHALNPESLKKSIELGAGAYIPKDQLGQIAPFLVNVLALSYQSAWKALFSLLDRSFGKRFGWEWRTSESEFWDKFEKSLIEDESAITRP